MVSELEKKDMLKSIIHLACHDSKKIPSDFGGRGKQEMTAFVKITHGKGGVVIMEDQAFNKAWNRYLAPQKA